MHDFSEVRVEGLETLDFLDNLQNKELFTEQRDALTFESEVSLGFPFYLVSGYEMLVLYIGHEFIVESSFDWNKLNITFIWLTSFFEKRIENHLLCKILKQYIVPENAFHFFIGHKIYFCYWWVDTKSVPWLLFFISINNITFASSPFYSPPPSALSFLFIFLLIFDV